MFVYDNVGIENVISPSNIIVFPNPFKELVEFNFNADESGETVVEIYDQYGHIIYQYNESVTSGLVKLSWKNSMSNRGIYYYRLLFDRVVISSGKIVKM